MVWMHVWSVHCSFHVPRMQNCKALIHADRPGVRGDRWRAQLGGNYQSWDVPRIISLLSRPHSKITSPTKVTAPGQTKGASPCVSQSKRRREAREAMAISFLLASATKSCSCCISHCPQQAGRHRLRPAWGKMVKKPGASTVLMTRSSRASMQRRQADRSCTNHTQRDTKPFC